MWLKPEIRSEEGVKYDPYLLLYANCILCIHHNADAELEWLRKSFPLMPGFGKPDMYLGIKLDKTRLDNGVWAWAISPTKLQMPFIVQLWK